MNVIVEWIHYVKYKEEIINKIKELKIVEIRKNILHEIWVNDLEN